MNSQEPTLPVLVSVDAKGGKTVGVAVIPVATLRENLRSATSMLADAFSGISEVGNYKLSEVELGVEITAEGGVQFIGTAKMSGTGSITLKFTKE